MITLNLTDIAGVTEGKLVGDNIAIDAIGTDSRALTKGQVFLALKGPNFDGHMEIVLF